MIANGLDRAPSPLVSPTNMYSGQPPPPYSYSSAAQRAGSLPGYVSPPDSRRALEEDKEKQAQQQRQSLPSIHEALGNENPLPYAGHTSGPPASQTHAPPRPLSSSLTGRPGGEGGPSGPPNPFSTSSSGSLFRDPAFQQPPLQADASRSSMNTQDSRNPSLNSLCSSGRSPKSAKTGITSISGSQPSSAYEYSAPPSSGSVASPNGYSAIPPSYPFQSQPPPNAPSYPTAPHYDARSFAGTSWKPAGGEPVRAESGLAPRAAVPGVSYADSVKRHLDIHDVEASLNEVRICRFPVSRAELTRSDRRSEHADVGLFAALRHTGPPDPTVRACFGVVAVVGRSRGGDQPAASE